MLQMTNNSGPSIDSFIMKSAKMVSKYHHLKVVIAHLDRSMCFINITFAYHVILIIIAVHVIVCNHYCCSSGCLQSLLLFT